MTTKKQAEVAVQEPVTNEDRKEALEQQKKQLELSHTKVLGALELLEAIMLQDKEEANAQKSKK